MERAMVFDWNNTTSMSDALRVLGLEGFVSAVLGRDEEALGRAVATVRPGPRPDPVGSDPGVVEPALGA